MMLGGRGFAGHARGFEFNCRYNEWSLTQFMFLKELSGCCVESRLHSQMKVALVRDDAGLAQSGGIGQEGK